MKFRVIRALGGLGAAASLTAFAVSGPGASAAVSGAVPFTSANFHGYANGTEVHVGAVTVGTTQLADVEQAFSGASANTAGITSTIDNEEGVAVQPPESPSVHSFARGTGLEVGVGTTVPAPTDANQVNLAGRAESTAPPNAAPVIKQIGPVNLSPVAQASALIGKGATFYDGATCPLGQPLSYGLGDAADANLLKVPGLVGGAAATPVLNTAGNGTSTAQSTSDTYLSPNGDGTFGFTTSTSDIIAPVTLDLLGIATVKISVRSAGGVDSPVTLTAKTTGESTGASVKLSTNDILTATITAGGTTTNLPGTPIPLSAIGANGLHIPLNTGQLNVTLDNLVAALNNLATSEGLSSLSALLGSNSQVASLLDQVGGSISKTLTTAQIDLNLGSLDIDTVPHAIGGSVFSPATVVGGTEAAGALDLLHLQLGLQGTIAGQAVPTVGLVNAAVGHLEAAANLAAPIDCQIPVVKSSSVDTVQAGNAFTYTIHVPDPAHIDAVACDLTHLTVVDTVADEQGAPTFTLTSDGAVNPASATSTPTTSATVTWTGLSWKPGQAPLTLTLTVHVPASSPAGRIEDTVVATATLSGCTGGTSGDTGVGTAVGGSNPTVTGTFTLHQPGVTAGTPAAPATTLPSALPFTGAMGGPWQPILGVGVLGIGGGAVALALRARRRRP